MTPDPLVKPFVAMSVTFVMMSMALALGGCAPGQAATQPVNVKVHDYCEIAEKVAWDVRDTPGTIQGIRRENAKWDRRCLRRNKSTS